MFVWLSLWRVRAASFHAFPIACARLFFNWPYDAHDLTKPVTAGLFLFETGGDTLSLSLSPAENERRRMRHHANVKSRHHARWQKREREEIKSAADCALAAFL